MNLAAILTTGTDGRWHPGIGDPSVLGWVTVFAYFLAVLAALRAALKSLPNADETGKARRDAQTVARFWAGVALCMIALGINKQLDLQTWFTEILRDLALAQGWYADRRPYQVAFIISIAVAGCIGLAGLVHALRGVIRRILGGAIGLLLITLFVIVRAASFHHVDMLLGAGRIRLNWVLELSGISVVIAAASLPRGTPRRHYESKPAQRNSSVD